MEDNKKQKAEKRKPIEIQSTTISEDITDKWITDEALRELYVPFLPMNLMSEYIEFQELPNC